MREVVIATFARSADADAYVVALRERLALTAGDIGTATVGAYGEAHDGDRLVVVWVPTDSVELVVAMVEAHEGVVHVAAKGARPAHTEASGSRASPDPTSGGPRHVGSASV